MENREPNTHPRANIEINFARSDWRARYKLFDKFALKDQRNYYNRKGEEFRKAASQVNRIRATLALFTGICSALAGTLVQIAFQPGSQCEAGDECLPLRVVVLLLTVLSVVLPAAALLFNTLADLYQWDRIIEVYDAASKTIEVADALSPLDDDPDDTSYRAALKAYAEGTLSVMADETAQWGQSIRTPKQLEEFVDKARERYGDVTGFDDLQNQKP